MFGLSEYSLITQGGFWPDGEGLVFDPVRQEPIAVIRDEPWPEVLERPWPDGVRGRPWLSRLFGVGGNPRQSRTVVRRLVDGCPLIRLHQRGAVFNETVGIFDRNDRRVGYCRWSFKGTGPADEFALVRIDHQKVAEVDRRGKGDYRVTAPDGKSDWAKLAVSRSGNDSEASGCRVALIGTAFEPEKEGIFLLAAAVVLFVSKQ